MNLAARNLDAYLVGGAVRDQLLGVGSHDRDWVVVGETPDTMMARGFRPVGADFPVFIHPESGEEYALARRERKTARGYKGFEIISDPNITLHQDLARRDLTINAMAMDKDGNLIDPFCGAEDLKRRVLKHISPAFSEDPLRVLRTAKFRARFDGRGFRVHQTTRKLMKQIVVSGEIDALQAERVWQELHCALSEGCSPAFIAELRACGALQKILPEIDALFGIPQTAKYHPEIDCGAHLLMALYSAHDISDDPRVIFAVLTHDLGKALTARKQLPSHKGHEKTGLKPLNELCERLRVPNKFCQLARAVCEYHLLHHRMRELKSTTVLTLLENLDAFRNPGNVKLFSLSCTADLRGRLGFENIACPQSELLLKYHLAAQSVDAALIAARYKSVGARIKKELRRARAAAIQKIKANYKNDLQ